MLAKGVLLLILGVLTAPMWGLVKQCEGVRLRCRLGRDGSSNISAKLGLQPVASAANRAASPARTCPFRHLAERQWAGV